MNKVDDQSTTFRRNRDNNGNVNLFRLNSSVLSPTGRFCCEIQDASDVNQMTCVNIGRSFKSQNHYGIHSTCHKQTFSSLPVPPINVQISGSRETPTSGENYALTCNVSAISVSTYQWRKNDDILNDQTSQILSFSPLRLSDAGMYTCSITVATVPYSTSQNITIQGKNSFYAILQRNVYLNQKDFMCIT